MINTGSIIKIAPPYKTHTNKQFQINNSQKITFSGQYYKDCFVGDGSKKYTLAEAEFVRENMKIGDKKWDEKVSNRFKAENEVSLQDIACLGKPYYDRKKTYVNRLSCLRDEFFKDISSEESARRKRAQDMSMTTSQLKQQKRNKKEKQLKPFCNSIKEDSITIPNCVKIKGTNKQFIQEIIEFIHQKSNVQIANIDNIKDLESKLKKAEEYYQKTKTRTLIHINKFDSLIDSINKNNETTDIKNLLSSAARDYHSTIIFSTNDSSKLNEVGLLPNDTYEVDGKIKSVDEIAIEKTKERLKNSNRITKLPIATINDLLKVYNINDYLFSNPDPKDLRDVEKALRNHINNLPEEKDYNPTHYPEYEEYKNSLGRKLTKKERQRFKEDRLLDYSKLPTMILDKALSCLKHSNNLETYKDPNNYDWQGIIDSLDDL